MEMPKHIEAILNGKVVIGGVELDLDDVRAIYYKMLGHELPGTSIREELSHVCEFVDVNYPEDTLKAEILVNRVCDKCGKPTTSEILCGYCDRGY